LPAAQQQLHRPCGGSTSSQQRHVIAAMSSPGGPGASGAVGRDSDASADAAVVVDAKALRKAIKRRVTYLDANRKCARERALRCAAARAHALRYVAFVRSLFIDKCVAFFENAHCRRAAAL
jgi:hypothetical protein